MSFDRFSLRGKRALITGASKGLGAGIAQGLHEVGAEVILCARPSPELEALAAQLQAQTMAVDVTDLGAFRAQVQTLGPLDIFVNNAGTNRPKPLSQVTVEDYDAVFDLNVRAAIFAAQAVAEVMEQGGSIINMSSQMGHVGAANRTLYCASKWALEGFTKALAVELGPRQIRVNTICPTFVETPMTKPFFEDPTFKAQVLSKIKLGRLAQIDEIVGAAIFLASPASAMMTGSAMVIDGGWTAD